MTAVFHDMMHDFMEDYVDDIVVKSRRAPDHLVHLKKVFERCRAYKLRMNPLKCMFGGASRKFLGFVVHRKGIDVDLVKVQAIQSTPLLSNKKELKVLWARSLILEDSCRDYQRSLTPYSNSGRKKFCSSRGSCMKKQLKE